MEIAQRICAILCDLLPTYDDTVDLQKQIDSLTVFNLIPRLEEAFGIEIFSIEVSSKNLQSVASLARMIESKLQN
jgi:acyl carrier protein